MKEIHLLPDAMTIENGVLIKYCGDCDSVAVPEGVTEIAEGAFFRKAHIKEISLPQSLRKIGAYAFYGACGIANMSLPAGLCEIGEGAFERCYFREAVIPAGVVKIEKSAFAYNDNLRRAVLPEGLCEIEYAAFRCCRRLSDVNIPASVKRIGSYAFSACDALAELRVPDGCETGMEFFEAPKWGKTAKKKKQK